MRKILAATLGCALMGALAVPVCAQDGDPPPPSFERDVVDTNDGDLVVDARAVDFSTMLGASHGAGGSAPVDVPIPDALVRVLTRAPGAEMQTVESRTDADGFFHAVIPAPAPGAIVEFLIFPGEDGEEQEGFYARPWTVDDGPPPTAMRCYRVTLDPSVLRIVMMNQVLTTLDKSDGRVAHLRTIATVRNLDFDFRVFFGFGDGVEGGAPVSIPLPHGFDLKTALVNDAQTEPQTAGGPHGGNSFVFQGAVFPSIPEIDPGVSVHLVATAPLDSSSKYDFSFHPELAVSRYMLNVEESAFHVTLPEDATVTIYDAGVNPPMGAQQRITRTFAVEGLPAHADVRITVHEGAPFPKKAVLWTAIIGLTVLAGVFLGLAARRAAAGRAERADAVASSTPRTELDRQLERGEITSVEHGIRARALPAAVPAGVAATLAGIESRADESSEAQLRDDVRTLARVLRDLLEGR